MNSFNTKAHIYSLNGEMKDVVIIQRGNEERKTATFWCEDTQILIDRE